MSKVLLLNILAQKIASRWSRPIRQLFIKFVRNTKKQHHINMQFQQSCFSNFSLVYNPFVSNNSGEILLKKETITKEYLLKSLLKFYQLFQPFPKDKAYFSIFPSFSSLADHPVFNSFVCFLIR